MSRKRHGKRKPDPAAALDSLASALNRCEKAGLTVKLGHGIVFTNRGYVLPVRGKWAARMLKGR